MSKNYERREREAREQAIRLGGGGGGSMQSSKSEREQELFIELQQTHERQKVAQEFARVKEERDKTERASLLQKKLSAVYEVQKSARHYKGKGVGGSASYAFSRHKQTLPKAKKTAEFVSLTIYRANEQGNGKMKGDTGYQFRAFTWWSYDHVLEQCVAKIFGIEWEENAMGATKSEFVDGLKKMFRFASITGALLDEDIPFDEFPIVSGAVLDGKAVTFLLVTKKQGPKKVQTKKLEYSDCFSALDTCIPSDSSSDGSVDGSSNAFAKKRRLEDSDQQEAKSAAIVLDNTDASSASSVAIQEAKSAAITLDDSNNEESTKPEYVDCGYGDWTGVPLKHVFMETKYAKEKQNHVAIVYTFQNLQWQYGKLVAAGKNSPGWFTAPNLTDRSDDGGFKVAFMNESFQALVGPVVFKVAKKEDDDNLEFHKADVHSNAIASKFAADFNALLKASDYPNPLPIRIATSNIIELNPNMVREHPEFKKMLEYGIFWTVEEQIEGEYWKATDNEGNIQGQPGFHAVGSDNEEEEELDEYPTDSPCLDYAVAFQHYSNYASVKEDPKEAVMVADIQGSVQTPFFTDLQILSSAKRTKTNPLFSDGNYGPEAIAQFYKVHTCNSICGALGIDKPAPVLRKSQRKSKKTTRVKMDEESDGGGEETEGKETEGKV
ncbi:hypothetical protein HDU98_003583 [Podochytrium sp. JEL0797]|nr:hypothetical protein HDU98_003583 [Podochytrium sp. JEL0797]